MYFPSSWEMGLSGMIDGGWIADSDDAGVVWNERFATPRPSTWRQACVKSFLQFGLLYIEGIRGGIASCLRETAAFSDLVRRSSSSVTVVLYLPHRNSGVKRSSSCCVISCLSR